MSIPDYGLPVSHMISGKRVDEQGNVLLEVRFAADHNTIAFIIPAPQAKGLIRLFAMLPNLPVTDALLTQPSHPANYKA